MGPEDLREAQGGDSQVVALEPEHGKADQPGEKGRHQPRQDQRDKDAQHQAHRAADASVSKQAAKELLEGKLHGAAAEEVIHLVLIGHGDGEDGVGIRAQEHEARLAQGEEPREAVEQVHGYRHQGVHRALFQHDEKLAGGAQHAGQVRDKGAQVFHQYPPGPGAPRYRSGQ